MGSEKPLLSICIPTYNQPSTVERLLRDLAGQISSEMEIIVRDDSINDETEKVVNEFKKKMPIRYFHGKKEGLDVAIIFLTREAKGKYVWWFGNDMMADGAIGHVLRTVKKDPEISFLFVNSRQITDKETEGVLKLGEERLFSDRNEVIEKVVDLLGFITATIIRRDDAVLGLESAQKYVGTAWVCLYIVLHVLSREGKSFFISYPYIITDSGDPARPTWYDGFTVFAINFYHIVEAFKGRFSRSSMRYMLSDNLDGIMKGIFVYRAEGYGHGLGSKEPKIRPLIKLYWNYPVFWKRLPLLFTPRPVAKFFYGIYKSRKKLKLT